VRERARHYVNAVILGDDMVPRFSIQNVDRMLAELADPEFKEYVNKHFQHDWDSFIEERVKKEKFAPLKRRRSVEPDAGGPLRGKQIDGGETDEHGGGENTASNGGGGGVSSGGDGSVEHSGSGGGSSGGDGSVEDSGGGSGNAGRAKRVAVVAAAVAMVAAETAVASVIKADKDVLEAWKLSEKCEDMWPAGRLFYIYRASGVYRVARLSATDTGGATLENFLRACGHQESYQDALQKGETAVVLGYQTKARKWEQQQERQQEQKEGDSIACIPPLPPTPSFTSARAPVDNTSAIELQLVPRERMIKDHAGDRYLEAIKEVDSVIAATSPPPEWEQFSDCKVSGLGSEC
jgi:hypothetical protein